MSLQRLSWRRRLLPLLLLLPRRRRLLLLLLLLLLCLRRLLQLRRLLLPLLALLEKLRRLLLACVVHRRALVGTLLLVDVPRQVAGAEQPFDIVSRLVLSEIARLPHARPVTQHVADLEAASSGVVGVASHWVSNGERSLEAR